MLSTEARSLGEVDEVFMKQDSEAFSNRSVFDNVGDAWAGS